jgi:hypothetical protein
MHKNFSGVLGLSFNIVLTNTLRYYKAIPVPYIRNRNQYTNLHQCFQNPVRFTKKLLEGQRSVQYLLFKKKKENNKTHQSNKRTEDGKNKFTKLISMSIFQTENTCFRKPSFLWNSSEYGPKSVLVQGKSLYKNACLIKNVNKNDPVILLCWLISRRRKSQY